MRIYNRPPRDHINTLSCIYDKFCGDLNEQEKGSLNAAMHVLDMLESNNGVLILDQEGE